MRRELFFSQNEWFYDDGNIELTYRDSDEGEMLITLTKKDLAAMLKEIERRE